MEDVIETTGHVNTEDLTKEELIKVINDKDLAANNYETELKLLKEKLTSYEGAYKETHDYYVQLTTNIIEKQNKKETALHQIFAGALNLMILDKEEVIPKKGEDKNEN